MSDEALRALERAFAEGDWTVYPRLARARAALEESPQEPPRVYRALARLRGLVPFDRVLPSAATPSAFNFFAVPAARPESPLVERPEPLYDLPQLLVRPERFHVMPWRIVTPDEMRRRREARERNARRRTPFGPTPENP